MSACHVLGHFSTRFNFRNRKGNRQLLGRVVKSFNDYSVLAQPKIRQHCRPRGAAIPFLALSGFQKGGYLYENEVTFRRYNSIFSYVD